MSADAGSPTSSALSRPSTAERAVKYVRDLIIDGLLPAGNRIPQNDVARALGISKIPLREALVVLEGEGWITIEAHRGAFVNELTADVVSDHFGMYGLLLGFAAQRAIERSSSDLAADLAAIRKKFVLASDAAEKGRLAVEFNKAVVAAARSSRLAAILRSMRGFPLPEFYTLVPSVARTQAKQMNAVVGAVQAKDGDAALDAYVRLMSGAASGITQVLRERGVLTEEIAMTMGGASA